MSRKGSGRRRRRSAPAVNLEFAGILQTSRQDESARIGTGDITALLRTAGQRDGDRSRGHGGKSHLVVCADLLGTTDIEINPVVSRAGSIGKSLDHDPRRAGLAA